MCTQCGYPAEIPLPGLGRAELVIGSAEAGQPRYTLDGAVTDIDVRIPDDLVGKWFWHGWMLVKINADGDERRLFMIDAGTYPPPGVPTPRGTCFDVARRHGCVVARLAAERMSRPAKRRQASRAKPRQEREIEAAQTNMFEG